MANGGLYYLPILAGFWFPITFLLTYIIAVELKDVPKLYPYISDTGTFSPESCIFGQLLNMGSILMGLVVYIKYRQVRFICEYHPVSKDVRKWNRYSLWLGILAAFGVSVVANFQETNIFSIHLLGAGLAFGLGEIYQILMVRISFKLFPIIGTKFGCNTRLVMAIIGTISSNICFISACISFTKFDGTDITKWSPKEGGYKYHVASSISEWITSMCLMVYIISFTNEFKDITIKEPPLSVTSNAVNPSPEQIERY